MKRHVTIPALFSLFLAGCGGDGSGSGATLLAFDLEGHHYEFKNAYYNVLGDVPVTSYTLEFSDLDCASEMRGISDDLDLQLFGNASSPFTVKIEFPDPAGTIEQNAFVEGSGTVVVDQQLPQIPINDMTAASVAALDFTMTGSVDLMMTGGAGGNPKVTAKGSFSATHCPRMDNP
jgi:hypothetical protein